MISRIRLGNEVCLMAKLPRLGSRSNLGTWKTGHVSNVMHFLEMNNCQQEEIYMSSAYLA